MKPRSSARWLSMIGAAALLIAGPAHAADVRVMISAGFYRVYSGLGPAFEGASGHHLVTTRGPPMGDSPEAIPARLARGEAADVVILDGGAADELGKRGLVRAESKIELARSLIGMVVRAGAAKPDIGSAEALRTTLLAAKSIVYSDSGSGLSIDHLVSQARHRRADRRQEPKGARASVRRAGGPGRRAWRGGDRFPTGRRTDPRPWNHLCRLASGGGPANDLFRGRAHAYGPAARSRERADPLPRLIRGGAGDPGGRLDATPGTIACTRGSFGLCCDVERPPGPIGLCR